jgi:flagella basal body P-ring formation protein FlgA
MSEEKAMRRLIVILIIISGFIGESSRAAELRLRQQCIPPGPVVTLGDVAEIYASDTQQAKKLASMELFPAPPVGQQRTIRVREVQDILTLRGINLTEHQLSGSSQVILTSSGCANDDGDKNAVSSIKKRSQRRLQEVVLQYLKTVTGSDEPRILQFEASGDLARAAASSVKPISISGGIAPWTGTQRFELKIDSPEGVARYPLEVRVSVSEAVVAAVHSLARGAVIRETDLTLVRPTAGDVEEGSFHAVADLVGSQTTRAIPDGKIFTAEDIQTQLIVRRGDVVTVYARGNGIRVRTTARARTDGGLGEMVTIETMHDRNAFQAKVCGPREAEVIAQAVPATEIK